MNQGIVNKFERYLVLLLMVMFPVGMIMMLTNFADGLYLWTTNIFLFLQGFLTFCLLLRYFGILKVILATIIIMLFTFLIELTGVKTGFPFGSYYYTDKLALLIFGVPVAISFAWYTIIINSFLVSLYLFRNSSKKYLAVFLSSIFAVGIDFLLEPFASTVNKFWIWNTNGIPASNFISWFIIGLLICIFLKFFWDTDKFPGQNRKIIFLPILILCINIILFGVINIYYLY